MFQRATHAKARYWPNLEALGLPTTSVRSQVFPTHAPRATLTKSLAGLLGTIDVPLA